VEGAFKAAALFVAGIRKIEPGPSVSCHNCTVILLLLLALQTAPPEGSLMLENGAKVTRVTTVRARIKVSSEGAGGLQMSLKADPKAAPAWGPYGEMTIVELPGGDGDKTVTLRLRDSKGAESAPVSAVIRLDTTPPVAKIDAPERVEASDLRAVFDVSDAVAVQYTEDVTSWSAWEPYTTPKMIRLSPGAGKKAVFFRFRDEAGNESLPARIVVEALAAPLPPAPGVLLRSLIVAVRRLTPSTLRLQLWMDGRNLKEASITLDGAELQPRGPWEAESTFEVPAADGPRRLIVLAWDAAGGEQRGEAVFQDRDAPAASPEEEAKQRPSDWSLALLGGVLMNGLKFDSSTLTGNRKIKEGPAAILRLEGEHAFSDSFLMKANFEFDDGKDLRVLSLGMDAGFKFRLGRAAGIDCEAALTLGAFVCRLDVEPTSFGNFRTGVGGRGAVELRASLTDQLWINAVVDWRYARIPYYEDVIGGDKDAKMVGPGLMVGLAWRF
jgi:hypothetical protein